MTFQIIAIMSKPNCPKSKGLNSWLIQITHCSSARGPHCSWGLTQLEVFAPHLWHFNAPSPLMYFHIGGFQSISRIAAHWLQRKTAQKCPAGKQQHGLWIINTLREEQRLEGVSNEGCAETEATVYTQQARPIHFYLSVDPASLSRGRLLVTFS